MHDDQWVASKNDSLHTESLANHFTEITDGGKLSAVARRRLLREAYSNANSGISAPTSGAASPASASSSAPTPLPVTEEIEHRSRSASDAIENLRSIENELSEDSAATQNQFTPLVEASAVKFNLPSREIEKVGDTALKIRLNRGQVCSQVCHIRFQTGSFALRAVWKSAKDLSGWLWHLEMLCLGHMWPMGEIWLSKHIRLNDTCVTYNIPHLCAKSPCSALPRGTWEAYRIPAWVCEWWWRATRSSLHWD